MSSLTVLDVIDEGRRYNTLVKHGLGWTLVLLKYQMKKLNDEPRARSRIGGDRRGVQIE